MLGAPGIRGNIVIAAVLCAALALIGGCNLPPTPKSYGQERSLFLPGNQRMIWAVAPTINLSGERQVDALLQSDIVYQQLQEVQGVTIIPVDRVVQVYTALHIEQVQSLDQAAQVCSLLNCQGLIIPTVTAYDPYDPPKQGAVLQLYIRPDFVLPSGDKGGQVVQAVGMFDCANGSVRQDVLDFARGRFDPNGAFGADEYIQSMDHFSEYVYHALIAQILQSPTLKASDRNG